ncbi:MAG: PDZ domain-containing protein [Pirellulales bacterium]|nr:PDZ domain-containing protein [Pirellulales bacterium]
MNIFCRSTLALICLGVFLAGYGAGWGATDGRAAQDPKDGDSQRSNFSERNTEISQAKGSSTGASALDDLDRLEQEALRRAVEAVADSVVQIRTVGGLDRVGKTLIAQGPTTGLIVSADGYIVSSAFNFAQQPSSILVRLPGGRQASAELVARDKNRMLVLLKVDTESPLPVPVAVPVADMKVGLWTIALGRTHRADRVGVSVGILSGRNRKYGRVVQTDASVSVANYGGPLVDLRGRVFGILVPMSLQSSGPNVANDLAGADTYDSGIGFAVPLEHIFGLLPRWRRGEDLLSGKLGIGFVAGAPHLQLPEIASVWVASPAAKAGWRAGDLITEIDGEPIATQAQLRFQIMPRYAGDSVVVSLRRGEQLLETSITLAGELAPFEHAFLGVLPARLPEQKVETGVLVRGIWPGSPAESAGLQAGDRLLKIDAASLSSPTDAVKEMNRRHPADDVWLTVMRQEQQIEVQARLGTLPEEILPATAVVRSRGTDPGDSFDSGGTAEQQADAQANTAAPQLQPLRAGGLLESLKLPSFSQGAAVYAPDFGKGVRPGLLVWLGAGTAEYDQQLLNTWQLTCQRDEMVLVIAHPLEEGRWRPTDLDFLKRLVGTARTQFKPDSRRIAVSGAGKAGQLALALALQQPNIFAGGIGLDAPLPRTLKIPRNVPNHRAALLVVESRNSTFTPLIRRDLQRLRAARYPVSRAANVASSDVEGQLPSATQAQIARWLDGLDKF